MAFFVSSPEISTKVLVNPNPNSRNHKNLANLSNNEKIGSRARVRVRVSGPDKNVRLIGQFSAPVKRSKEEEEKQNYHVNMGYAIRSLREGFPALFHRELSFDIYRIFGYVCNKNFTVFRYSGDRILWSLSVWMLIRSRILRDDIVFKDPMNTFIGIENYKSVFWALRFHGRMFFRALWIDIVSMWQPMENVIMVRWTVHGIPRVLWESRGRFDGSSEYKVDKNGKIYEHRVDNFAHNSPSKFRVLPVEELIQSIGCPSTPKPTYFESSSSDRN